MDETDREMKVLLTNDDGIASPGLRALGLAISGSHDVVLAAPRVEQSGISHAITIRGQLRTQVDESWPFPAHIVDGTPADCVRLGLRELCPDCELVCAGINAGANLGRDKFYSGTIGAVLEAAISGVHAVAISADTSRCEPDYRAIASSASVLIGSLAQQPWNDRVAYSINFPGHCSDGFLGLKVVPQGYEGFTDSFAPSLDRDGLVCYEIEGGEFPGQGAEEAFDALARGFVTLTPIQPDLTAGGSWNHLRKIRFEGAAQ